MTWASTAGSPSPVMVYPPWEAVFCFFCSSRTAAALSSRDRDSTWSKLSKIASRVAPLALALRASYRAVTPIEVFRSLPT